jgi:hypothetical protein
VAAAFLPWEKWLARLLHPIAVATKRRLYRIRRRRSLTRSQHWPQTQGTVLVINWDSSCPREEILYSYTTEQGYQSGSHWHWFDRLDPRQVRVGDQIVVRYDPDNQQESVFLQFCP